MGWGEGVHGTPAPSAGNGGPSERVLNRQLRCAPSAGRGRQSPRSTHVVQRPLQRVGAARGNDVLVRRLGCALLEQACADEGVDWVALERAHEGQRPEQGAALGEDADVVQHGCVRRGEAMAALMAVFQQRRRRRRTTLKGRTAALARPSRSVHHLLRLERDAAVWCCCAGTRPGLRKGRFRLVATGGAEGAALSNN